MPIIYRSSMPAANRLAATRSLQRCYAGYLVAHSAKSLVWHSSGLLFAFFLTETCGLSPGAMGAVIALSLMVNALADVAFGTLWHRCQRMPFGLGRAQAVGGVLAAVSFVTFCALPFAPVVVRFPVAAVLLIAFRLSFAMLDVSQNAMVAMLARSPSARSGLLAARNICSGLASLAVALVAVPTLLSGTDRALRHLCWAGMAGCAVALSAALLARSRALRHAGPPADASSIGRPIPFNPLLAIAGMLVVASTLFRSLEPYVVAYAGVGRGILLWASVGAIAGQPLWFLAASRLSPAPAAALAGSIALVGAAALVAPQTPHGLGGLLAGLGFGIGSGGLWLMLWTAAVQTDALRRTARLSAVSKTAQAIAALSLGQMLHGTGYRFAVTGPGNHMRTCLRKLCQ